jgi:hypothetical protein
MVKANRQIKDQINIDTKIRNLLKQKTTIKEDLKNFLNNKKNREIVSL